MTANLRRTLALALCLLLALCSCFTLAETAVPGADAAAEETPVAEVPGADAGAEETPAAEAPGAMETLLEIVPLEPGMRGDEVKDLNARLILLGYLSGELSDEYSDATEEAVRAFQAVAGIESTGVADVVTEQYLQAADAPVNPENPLAGEMVWVSKTGSKYHSNWNCSGMEGPSCVPIDEAIERGLGPCGKCYPEEADVT